MAKDLSTEILKQIRDAVTQTNVRLEETNARVDALAENVAVLGRRQTETELRLASELVEVTRAVNGVRDLLRERLDDRQRVDDHERRIAALERKTA